MIEMRGVSWLRGGRAIVDDVTLAVRTGEFVALAGPNGAGKSSLLGIATGALAPTSGEVRLGGVPLTRLSLLERAKRRVVVAQHVQLTMPFTAFDVVMMGRSPHIERRERECDYLASHAAMIETDTWDFARRNYSTLSGGERQRVQLARALAQIGRPGEGPCVLMLDEPTSSLDLAHQHRALAVVRKLAARGIAVLCVLHDLNLAARWADRLALMREGRLVADGRPAEVLEERLLERVFDVSVRLLRDPNEIHPIVVTDPPIHQPAHA
jgi:iron complex transport system ATP-binding protein